MTPFDYIAVQTVDEACSYLSEYGSDARILAGGTDLLVELRRANRRTPRVILDISFLKDQCSIASSKGTVTIKCLATHTDLMQSDVITSMAPLLSIAASVIGAPQIRNRGTVGGNIMNAAACADTVPPLIALEARVTLQSKRGTRQLALAELFLKPYQTNAQPDELLTEIQFSQSAVPLRTAFIKLGRRNALSISRLSIAAILRQDDSGKIIDARLVPGATFPTWRRVHDGENILIGERPSTELFKAAGHKVSELMIQETGRRWSTEYKEPVLAVLVRRALEQCVSSDRQQENKK